MSADRPSIPVPTTPTTPAAPAPGGTPAPAASPRLMSLDALRGFDMFWILGAGTIFVRINELVNMGDEPRFGWLSALAGQLKHKEWEGFAFEDLIFPLFVFMVGVSIVYSLSKHLQQGKGPTYVRIVRRFLLLFALGVFAAGGLRHRWPDVQLCGVLHRLAWAYLFGALIFLHLRPKAIVGLVVAILVGYWALMTYVPFPNVPLPESRKHPPAADEKFPDLTAKFDQADKIAGSYTKELNLCHYIDARYMPGRKYTGYYSPEGILSTMTAVATCLLGVLAGYWLRRPSRDWVKVLVLLGLGAAGVALGFLWGQSFPVIKKIWTSSFVLVAGGYSAILLGLFYLVIDVWKWRWWCLPFVWIGMNAITVYMVPRLVDVREIAYRLTGGNVAGWLDSCCGKGWSGVLTTVVSFLLIWWLAFFLYRRKVFLRL